ncbi:otopetrin-1-like isoform X4 [Varroa destructor]|uniref:Uncharacterized protein n=1 Tax=Varroa destructor TaxID=109461 RepID=A0A7M7K610_VARDE|nr:otopetrin-1-like isoform X4 [Varroa destructor]
MDAPIDTDLSRMIFEQPSFKDNNAPRASSLGDVFDDRSNRFQGPKTSSSEFSFDRRGRLQVDLATSSPVYTRYRRRFSSIPINSTVKGGSQNPRRTPTKQLPQNGSSQNIQNLQSMSGLSSSEADLNNLSGTKLTDGVFAYGGTELANRAYSKPHSSSRVIYREARPGDSVSMQNGNSGKEPTYDDTIVTSNSSTNTMREKTRENLFALMSVIYASFIVSLGTIFSLVSSSVKATRFADQIFSWATYVIGIAWLIFLQVDIALYKSHVVRRIKEKLEQLDGYRRDTDRVSMTTDVVLETINKPEWQNEEGGYPRYRFQKGRHSGSFFLKTGMAAFCFGHLIYEGLILAKLITKPSSVCHIGGFLALHVLRPLYSFYQLFMVFKYSHIIINHFTPWARFGVMHIIATSIISWFRTIILDAQASHSGTDENAGVVHVSENAFDCVASLPANLPLLAYLYPFTIEFSIIMAGVWFIIWTNIGSTSSHHTSHAHLEARLKENEYGDVDLTYRSHLVLSADCHSAKTGIFAGMVVLLLSIVTVILFFVFTGALPDNVLNEYSTNNSVFDVVITGNLSSDHLQIAKRIYNFQDGMLISISLVAVGMAFMKTRSLSFNPAPITFLDDCLLVIPIPFFIVNTALNVVAELTHDDGTTLRACFAILKLFQVLVQTPMLIDGLRRCSFSTKMSYQKPGRELVTFLIVVNLAMWFVYTFEQKKVDEFLAAAQLFHDRWTYIAHTTVPLMLFYRAPFLFQVSFCGLFCGYLEERIRKRGRLKIYNKTMIKYDFSGAPYKLCRLNIHIIIQVRTSSTA